MVYQLKKMQKLPISAEVAWLFLSNPKNLTTITPDDMKFKILDGGEGKMHAGQIIKYTVSPILGITIQWVTEITHVKDNEYFVDEQRFGPYRFWHHKHFIKPILGGVEMVDIVDYKLPFGIFGRMAHSLFVKHKLKRIFDYRYNKLIELFGEFEH